MTSSFEIAFIIRFLTSFYKIIIYKKLFNTAFVYKRTRSTTFELYFYMESYKTLFIILSIIIAHSLTLKFYNNI